MPLTSAGLVVCGLSLIGVPGTVGFVTKWYLVLAALEQGQWWLVLLIVTSSLLSMAYVWRFVEAAYLREPAPGPGGSIGALPPGMALPAALLVAATVYFGLDTSLPVGSAAQAAAQLLGGSR
jgi:multicomponent Na+:H+ antiporter subunit D